MESTRLPRPQPTRRPTCPTCGPNRLTKAEVKRRANAKGLEVVGLWPGVDKPNLFRCLRANHHWKAKGALINSPTAHCAACRRNDWVKEVTINLRARGLVRLSPLLNMRKPTTFGCLAWHHTWESTGNSVISMKTGCPTCYKFRSLRG